MSTQPDCPDPSLYIERLANGSAFHREAAAWTLGELGNARAARPLAGLLLRELESVERSGYVAHDEVVRAVVEAIRRIGSTETLYALVKALCVLSHSQRVDRVTVEEIVESLGAVGGFHAVREAADKVVCCARDCRPIRPGLTTVCAVLLERLGLCGDPGVATLRRLVRSGPEVLRPLAESALKAL